jgi:aspartate dehydrogenase
MIRIGLLGCGNIGHIIAKYQGSYEIAAFHDQIFERSLDLSNRTCGIPCHDFESFIAQEMDVVVEAASVQAVRLFGKRVLNNGKDLVVMSVGALSDPFFRDDLIETARKRGKKIHIPSGAIFGLDNLKVGKISEISRLLLRTTKSPASLGIPTNERKMVFQGKADDCIREFPKNINVSVAISLAAGKETDVELYVDPEVDRNQHEIFIEGEFGEAYIRIQNVPSPGNPATSYLAALSILTLLERMNDPLVVGT